MEARHKAYMAQVDANRGTAHQRGYTARWRKVRKAFLMEHPLCIQCQHEGKLVAASVVDHIVPHRGDWQLFNDPDNLQPLCKQHHDAKTMREVSMNDKRRELR